jgi:PKD repeat protein
MPRLAVFISYLFILTTALTAQVQSNNSDHKLTAQDYINTDKVREASQNKKIVSLLTESKPALNAPGTVTLPVVVHIFHNEGVENISDTQVRYAIDLLNEQFRGDASGINMQIEFCLATRTPSGLLTDGINRVQSSLATIVMERDDAALKKQIQWNPSRFINIWVVKTITSEQQGPSICAYSSMPSAAEGDFDGIVIEAGAFGVSPELSKVLVHCMGHYFGLYHTFEGGCKNENCLTDGDYVCDTPPDATSQFVNCASASINSCMTDDNDISAANPYRPSEYGGTGDQVDKISNYMDINFLSCVSSFTQGQKDRINAVIQTVRPDLLIPGNCNRNCTNSLNASFTVPSTQIPSGSVVMFNNTTIPDSNTTYDWYVNGTAITTTKSPVYTFSTPGTYNIRLVARTESCTDEYTKTFRIFCPLKANFLVNGASIKPSTPVHIVNTTAGIYNASKWLIDNVQVSTSQDLDYTFTKNGKHTISLIAGSQACESRKDFSIDIGGILPVKKYMNNWYFGYGCGLTFASGLPSLIQSSPSFAKEGCASISDEYGNYLFSILPLDGNKQGYSMTVRDKNHNIMPNGNEIAGGESVSQLLIVPNPVNSNIYYVFTAQEMGSGGLYVSTVDMSQNSGLGDVVKKNVLIQDVTTEKIAAVLHADRKNYWVVTHPWNSGEFHAFLVNGDGVAAKPVISTAGSINAGDESGACGTMKFSSDGRYLAMTSQYLQDSYAELFDFDNRTGKVSQFVKFNNVPQAYGLEFSPDCTKLYISCGWNSQQDGGLYQYTITSDNSLDVLGTRYLVYPSQYYGQLQLGPDQKIYCARVAERYLGVIQNPDKPGSECNYDHDGLLLDNSKLSSLGLPSFVASFTASPELAITGPKEITPSTKGITFTLSHSLPGDASVQWHSSGPVSISSQSKDSVVVNSKSAGTAKLIAKISRQSIHYSDTMVIQIRKPSINLGTDLVLCIGGSILLNPGDGFTEYKWQNGSTAPVYRVIQPGTYTVKVTSAGGATATDDVIVKATGVLDLGPDQIVCPNTTIVLNAGGGFMNYKWQDGSTNPTFTASQRKNGTYRYSVTATDMCGKTVSDDVLITFDTPRANAGPDKKGCAGEPVLLRGYGNGKFRWLDSTGFRISSSQEISVNPSQSTFYIFKTEFDGCAGLDTVRVSITPDCPSCYVSAGTDIVTKQGKPVTLTAITNGHCTRSNCSNRTPPSDYLSKVTSTLTGTSHYDIALHQIACIPAETVFKGSVDVNGGTLIVAGVASLKKINFTSGRIIITGELSAPYFTICDTFDNYGTVRIEYDASIVGPGCLNNYGSFSVNGTLTLNSKAYNHSNMYAGNDLIQKSSDLFTNECSLLVGNDFHINGTFINKGSIAVSFNTFIKDGSQYISDDGCNITSKNMYIESSIQGGSAGMSNITIQEEMHINKNASVSGRIDICDKNGIELVAGKVDKSVSTDCRTSADGTGGVASFVWYDSMGNIAGTGKSITIIPQESSAYTVTVIDVNGNSVSDHVNIKVE